MKALCHPTPEELGDWHDYQKLEAEERAKQTGAYESDSTTGGTPSERDTPERDSGYFSRRVSNLDTGID